MPATRSGTRRSAPPSSSRHVRHMSDSHHAVSAHLARVFEDDADDEDEQALRTPHRSMASPLRSSVIRKSHHRRTQSHTHADHLDRSPMHLTPTAKRRIALRPSLAGPRVQGMTVDERARVVSLLAQDCIVKLLSAGLGGMGHTESSGVDWRAAWDSLQVQRHQSLFVEHHLPFTDILDVTQAFHKNVQGRIDPDNLARANDLCNLATFIYIILDPDQSARMLSHSSGYVDDFGQSAGSRKGKERERTDDSLQEHVRNRNRILLMAWKQYWAVVIPRQMRTSKRAMDLWLNFSTQICMTFTSEKIGERSMPDLPSLGEDVMTTLFAASAIIRRGQWLDTQRSVTPDAEATEMDVVEHKWAKLAARRRKELVETRDEVLADRYRWSDFRSRILRLIDEEILYTLFDRSVSPRKPAVDDAHVIAPPQPGSDASQGSSPDMTTDTTPSSNDNDDREVEEVKPEPIAHDLIDFDQFQYVLEDMQKEGTVGLENDGMQTGPSRASDATPTQRSNGGVGFNAREHSIGPNRSPLCARDRVVTPAPERPTRQPLFQINGTASDTSAGPSTTRRSRRRALDRSQLHDLDDDLSSASSVASSRPRTRSRALAEPTQSPDVEIHATPRADDRRNQRSGPDLAQTPGSTESEVRHDSAGDTYMLDQEAMTGADGRVHYDSDDEAYLPGSSILGSATRTSLPTRHPVTSGDDDEDILPGSSVLGTPSRRRVDSLTPTRRSRTPNIQSATPRQPQQYNLLHPLESGPRGKSGDGAASVSISSPSMSGSAARSTDLLPTIRPASELLEPATILAGADSSRREVSIVRLETVQAEAPIAQGTPSGSVVQPVAEAEGWLGQASTVGEIDPQDAHEQPSEHMNADITDQAAVAEEPVVTRAPSGTDDTPEITSITRPHQKSSHLQPHRSQHVLVNHHRRRYQDPEFAGPDSDETPSDDDAADRGTPPPPPIRVASKTPTPRSPLAEMTVNEIKTSPLVQLDHESIDDFIVVPPFEPLPEELRFRSRLSKSAVPVPEPVAEVVSSTNDVPPGAQVEAEATDEGQLDPDDPYLFDEDGSPLEPDAECSIPPKYEFPPSRLHGQKGDQASTYSRKAGTRRWTQEEALLLYRTVQKVPLDQLYPLRVVWYLYGEHGIESHELEDFNPQHMKDKMKTIVQTRINNLRPVTGRARFWLPPISRGEEHPDKAALKTEIEEAAKAARGEDSEPASEIDARPPRRRVKRQSTTTRRRRTTRSGKRDHATDSDDGNESAQSDDPGVAARNRRISHGTPQEGEEELSDTSPRPPKRRRPGRPRKSEQGAQRRDSRPSAQAKGSKRRPASAASGRHEVRSDTNSVSARHARAQQRVEKKDATNPRTSKGRPMPFVELPLLRLGRAAAERARSASGETRDDGDEVELLVEDIRQDSTDSGEETDTHNLRVGKQMKRTSMGERLLSPVDSYISGISSDDDDSQESGEDEDDDVIETNAEDAGEPPSAKAGPSDVSAVVVDADGLDITDPNARAAHEMVIRQRVLAGYDDSLPQTLLRRR